MHKTTHSRSVRRDDWGVQRRNDEHSERFRSILLGSGVKGLARLVAADDSAVDFVRRRLREFEVDPKAAGS